MVRFTVLASGSKGNATVLSGGRTRILVDCGLSCRELIRRMRQVGEEPETLDAILITHEHADHVGGVAVTARKLGIPVYFTEGTHRAWMRWISPRRQMTYAQWLEQIRKQAAERQAESDVAEEGDPDESDVVEVAQAIKEAVEPVELDQGKRPHMAPGGRVLPGRGTLRDWRHQYQPLHHPSRRRRPGGLCLPAEGVRMGFATDLGYIPPNVKAQLKAWTCCCSNPTTIWRCCGTAPTPGRSSSG